MKNLILRGKRRHISALFPAMGSGCYMIHRIHSQNSEYTGWNIGITDAHSLPNQHQTIVFFLPQIVGKKTFRFRECMLICNKLIATRAGCISLLEAAYKRLTDQISINVIITPHTFFLSDRSPEWFARSPRPQAVLSLSWDSLFIIFTANHRCGVGNASSPR